MINMVSNSLQYYQAKINEKMKVIMVFLASFFIITCLFSLNTSHSIQFVSGSGDNSTSDLNPMTTEPTPIIPPEIMTIRYLIYLIRSRNQWFK